MVAITSYPTNSFINDGIEIYGSNKNKVENNSVNGKPLVYLEDESDRIIDIDAGQLILINCYNITVQNQNISNTSTGIRLISADNCILSNNTIIFNSCYGINLYSSESTVIHNNITSNQGHGIFLVGSNNVIKNNTIISNQYNGITARYSDNNKISFNTIKKSSTGIELSSSNNNVISANLIEMNDWSGIQLGYFATQCDLNIITDNYISNNNFGIFLRYSDDNAIYHNNFKENIENANTSGDNIWDDDKYGNYWSDYEDKYPNAKPKILKPWMWNTPYEMEGGDNIDMCPLVKQWPESLSRTLPRNLPTNKPFLNWLQNNPNMFPLLQRMFQRFGLR